MSKELSTGQLWALAAGDVLLSANGYEYSCEYDTGRSGINPNKAIEILAEGWGVTDDITAWSRLEGLTVGGHRKEVDQLRSVMSVMTHEQQLHYISSFQDPIKVTDLSIIQRYYRLLPLSGILSWDLGRAAFICHLCLESGYIQKDEAWSFLMKNASHIQQSYSSWQEYGTSYIIGRQFWAGEIEDEHTQQNLNFISSQFTKPDSPWAILPWYTDLKE